MKRIKLLLLTLAFAMTFGGALAPVVVAGATPMAGPVFADFKDSACEGIGQIGGKCGGGFHRDSPLCRNCFGPQAGHVSGCLKTLPIGPLSV